MIPDFKDFNNSVIVHSAKGSTWKKHKYIKIMNGLYFYPDDYIGGRHLKNASNSKKNKKDKEKSNTDKDGKKTSGNKDGKNKMSKKKVNRLASKVISGKFGNGQERIDKLGRRYNRVQHRVNQILLGNDRAKAIRERKRASTTASTKKKTTSKKTTTKKSTSKR